MGKREEEEWSGLEFYGLCLVVVRFLVGFIILVVGFV